MCKYQLNGLKFAFQYSAADKKGIEGFETTVILDHMDLKKISYFFCA